MAETVDGVLKNFIENLDCVISQIKDGETERAKDAKFEITEYWVKIGSVFKMMSHEATKLSLAFSPTPPSLEACKSLVESVEKTTLTLISLYYTLPKSCGKRLKKSLKSAVCDIVDGMKSVAEAIKENPSRTQEQLQSVGIVWEGADIFKNLPKDDKEAVLIEVGQSTELVKDALEELEEAIKNGGQDEDWSEIFGEEESESISNRETWSELDKKLLGPCVGLIKTSKSLLKKTMSSIKSNGRCDIQEEITQFDTLADYTARLSPHVDDLALNLYPPIKYDNVQENAESLFNLHSSILNFLRHSHITSEEDQKWVEFLLKANQHNWDKIQQCISGTVT